MGSTMEAYLYTKVIDLLSAIDDLETCAAHDVRHENVAWRPFGFTTLTQEACVKGQCEIKGPQK